MTDMEAIFKSVVTNPIEVTTHSQGFSLKCKHCSAYADNVAPPLKPHMKALVHDENCAVTAAQRLMGVVSPSCLTTC